MVNNLFIADPALLIHTLTSLSVDEILLPRYMKWSINFRGFPINEERELFSIKYINSFLSEFVMETNAFGCLLQQRSKYLS